MKMFTLKKKDEDRKRKAVITIMFNLLTSNYTQLKVRNRMFNFLS